MVRRRAAPAGAALLFWRWQKIAFLLRLEACDEGLRARVDELRLVERPAAQLRDEGRGFELDLDVHPAILEPEWILVPGSRRVSQHATGLMALERSLQPLRRESLVRGKPNLSAGQQDHVGLPRSDFLNERVCALNGLEGFHDVVFGILVARSGKVLGGHV